MRRCHCFEPCAALDARRRARDGQLTVVPACDDRLCSQLRCPTGGFTQGRDDFLRSGRVRTLASDSAGEHLDRVRCSGRERVAVPRPAIDLDGFDPECVRKDPE